MNRPPFRSLCYNAALYVKFNSIHHEFLKDDTPLVRANGRANRNSSPSDLPSICTPSALIRLQGHAFWRLRIRHFPVTLPSQLRFSVSGTRSSLHQIH